MLRDKRILLIIGGGIAAYKTLELIRRLRDQGASMRAILTGAGARFVTPLSVASLTGNKAHTDLFDLTDEAEIGHIELSRAADLVVVAPATADLMAKMAAGLADDLASTALLATDKRILLAPAMNVRMWHHRATQRNLARLIEDGVMIVGPEEGDMACGEFGLGRMAEPAAILAAIAAFFEGEGAKPLAGRKALVTSGPTYEPIDPVRFLGNRSSGKQGHAIAGALARFGAQTVLVSGPTALADPLGVEVRHVETAREMLAACEQALPVDIAVCAAAVADWRPDQLSAQKLKKSATKPALALIENPDIVASLGARKNDRPALVVGFAAETESVIAHAEEKRARKGCDWILANDVSPARQVMGGDFNTVHLLTAEGSESWPTMTKVAVAEALARRIAGHFGARA